MNIFCAYQNQQNSIFKGFAVFFLVGVWSFQLHAQKSCLDRFEKRKEMSLQYVQADVEGVNAQTSGSNIQWDFTDLNALDTITQQRLHLDSIAKAQFSEGEFMEVAEDKTFSVYKDVQGRIMKLGVQNEAMNIRIEYPDPLMVGRCPMKFNDKISKNFTSSYSVGNQSFTGEGEVVLEADGTGTLFLPGKTYRNVLRIKMEETVTDYINKHDEENHIQKTTYLWFDDEHKNPLLKITEVRDAREKKKEIRYLLKEQLY